MYQQQQQKAVAFDYGDATGRYHTGDPAADLAYEQANPKAGLAGGAAPAGQQQQQYPAGTTRPDRPAANMPDDVAYYLRYFQQCIRDKNVHEIHNLYEYGFPELTEKHYREKYWPSPEQVKRQPSGIAPQQTMGDDKVFIMLYTELYFRYIYAKMQRGPNLEVRINSYQNYNDLFFEILEGAGKEGPFDLLLPNGWLWDIIDEFIYQFQSFCLYKANPSKHTPADVEGFMEMADSDVWSLYAVINVLYSFVSKSQVQQQLQAINNNKDPAEVASAHGAHPLYFKLGYFSLVGLLRLHVLLGDYHQALKVVQHIELDPKVDNIIANVMQGLYNTVPICLVTLHYLLGFTHMIHRNYAEATRLFVNCMMYIQRTRNTQQQTHKPYQYDVISKTNDQLYHLMSICMVLQPQRIDETVHSQLVEKHADRMNRMHRGELADFEQAFQFGCPKFIAPTTNTVDPGAASTHKDPVNQQVRVFMDEMEQLVLVPILRGYLKQYTTLPVDKLASFREDTPVQVLTSQLICFKHKLCDVTDKDREDEDTGADLDFYVDKDMIHIADTKVGRRVGEYFVKHIQKLMELNRDMKVKARAQQQKVAAGVPYAAAANVPPIRR